MARPASSQRRRYPRAARVNEVLRETLADELERLSDPRLGFVTVTGVDASPDLRHATVYYSVLVPEEGGASGDRHEETRAALSSAAPHLRAEVGRQVRLKYLPELVFREDPAIAAGERVEQIIRELHRHDAAPDAAPDAATNSATEAEDGR